MQPQRFFMGRAIGILIILVIAGLAFAYYTSTQQKLAATVASSAKDASYTIDGKPVQLVQGVSETEAAPGSATKIVTRYFGNEVRLDLNDDGREDSVFLLTQDPGGSGTFFYVVAALNTEAGYVGSHGYLLGDRISPQTTEISQNPMHDRVIVVNYADKSAGEPATASSTMAKSVWLKLDPASMQFGEVQQDFEGEADPSKMKLDMKPWVWVSTLYNADGVLAPKQAGKFTVMFAADGKFTATTDCNSVEGSYLATDSTISFSGIFSTKMFCEGSQETEFIADLEKAAGFHFTSKGELVLELKMGSGSMTFK